MAVGKLESSPSLRGWVCGFLRRPQRLRVSARSDDLLGWSGGPYPSQQSQEQSASSGIQRCFLPSRTTFQACLWVCMPRGRPAGIIGMVQRVYFSPPRSSHFKVLTSVSPPHFPSLRAWLYFGKHLPQKVTVGNDFPWIALLLLE